MKAPEPVRGEILAQATLPHPDDHELALLVIDTVRDFIVTWYSYKNKEYFWGTYYPKANKEGKDYWDLKAEALLFFAKKVEHSSKEFLNAEVI